MDMAIVIATTGERIDLIERTLRSLAESKLPDAYRETIVIENGSRHGIEDVLENSPDHLHVRYLYESRANKAAALNVVLEQCEHEFLLFMDDDIRVSRGVVRAYAQAANKHGRGHFFGGPFECDYESPPEPIVRPYLPASARGWRLPDGQKTLGPNQYFLGCNWAAFRADLIAAGGFHDIFGPGSASGATGDETAMQKGLLARGAKAVYLPSAMVWHYVPMARSSRQWVLNRKFRNGIESAHLEHLFESNPAGLIKYSLVYLSLSAKLMCRGLATLSREDIFGARAKLAEWRGIRRGLAIKRAERNRRQPAEDSQRH